MSPRRTDVNFNKSHFRDSIVPENNDRVDIGIEGNRWDTIRCRRLLADVFDTLATTITTLVVGTLTVSTSAILSYLTGPGYLKIDSSEVVGVQAVPIPIADGGTNAITAAAARTALDVRSTAEVAAAAGGWTDDGSVVRLTTAADQVALGTATAFTGGYELTILDDNWLALQATTGGETWLFKRQAPVNFGSNQTLTVEPAVGGAGLQLHLISATGGQRVAIWDPTNALPNIPHTGVLPTLAVYGDIMCGDIVAIASNPMTYFIRANTGLAETAVTQLFSAKAGVNDTDGGAQIIYAPSKTGVVNDGYIDLVAYGQGSAALANSVLLSSRSGIGAVTRRWQMGGPGNVGDFFPFASNTYRLGTTTLAPKSVAASAGTGTGTGHVPVVLNLATSVGTGCPADTNENDLKTYTLPAASLATDGDTLRVTMSFRCAANATTKRIRLYFGGTAILDSSAIAQNGAVINAIFYIARTGATAQYVQGVVNETATQNVWSTAVTGDVAFPADPGKTLANAQIIKATVTLGAGAALNDVIQDMMIVEYMRAA